MLIAKFLTERKVLPALSRHSVDEIRVKFGSYLFLGTSSLNNRSVEAAGVIVVVAFVSTRFLQHQK